MTNKYEDLYPVIIGDETFDLNTAERAGVKVTLQWLDENIDQTPGRTITERVKITDTEAYELYESAKSFSLDDFKLALESIDGIETVDDPEPTNAEKLGALIAEKFQLEYRGDPNDALGIGRYLDEAGVKAPGASDA